MSRTTSEQLIHFLSDMYSVELQALAQLVSAPDMARDPGLAGDLRMHYMETEAQADLVRALLDARGGSYSGAKNAVMKLGGKGFLLFAKAMPETPGRLLVHAYSYEAMEWAGYGMLLRFAEAAGDVEVAAAARDIRGQERTMMDRLERRFDSVELESEATVSPEQLRKHIAEAHALESQSIEMLKKSGKIAGDSVLASLYEEHLVETRRQASLLEERLEALGGSPSIFKDAAVAMGAINWGLFFQAQSDTPAKLAAFAYALEHLEIGAYEMLRRSSRRAGDLETASLADRILAEERAAAEKLSGAFDIAARATLERLEG